MKEIIKKRTILVEGMTCENCEKKINTALINLDGVQKVNAKKEGKVYVEYDLMKVNLETIENKITELNYSISDNFFDKIKRGFINFKEQNEYDNMHAEPHSCCKIPEKHANH